MKRYTVRNRKDLAKATTLLVVKNSTDDKRIPETTYPSLSTILINSDKIQHVGQRASSVSLFLGKRIQCKGLADLPSSLLLGCYRDTLRSRKCTKKETRTQKKVRSIRSVPKGLSGRKNRRLGGGKKRRLGGI